MKIDNSQETKTITSRMVATLRAETDAPMMECKKALIEPFLTFEE